MLICGQRVYFKSSEDMSEVPSGTIDVIVTSPPYNRGKPYSDEFRDNLPEDEYFSILHRVFSECFRVLREDGVFFLNVGDSAEFEGFSERVVSTAVSVGWIRLQTVIWVKSIHGRGHYTPSGGTRRFNNVFEYIYILVKDRRRYRLNTKAIGIPYADKGNIGRYSDEDLRDPGNVWHIPYSRTTGKKVKKGHPAPFPIELPYLCIKSVPDAKVALDPFLGTGSTLAACVALGIDGIGYDPYAKEEIVKKRIEEGKKFVYRQQPFIPHYEAVIEAFMKRRFTPYTRRLLRDISSFLEYRKHRP